MDPEQIDPRTGTIRQFYSETFLDASEGGVKDSDGWPGLAPFFFVGALFFHTSLYFAAGHDFFQNMVLLFLCLLFLTPGGWRAWSVDLMERFHLGARKDARVYQST
jgi:hypothetical protein